MLPCIELFRIIFLSYVSKVLNRVLLKKWKKLCFEVFIEILRYHSLTIFQVHVMCLEIELYKGTMILGSLWNITRWYIDRSCCWRPKYHVTVNHKVVSKNNKWKKHTWVPCFPCQIIYSLLKLCIIFHVVFNVIIATTPCCRKRPLKRNPTNQFHENRCASKIILIPIYTEITNQTWCRLTLKQFKKQSESSEASISDTSRQINMTSWIIQSDDI